MQKEYVRAAKMSAHDQKIFKNRLEFYDATGANEHYLGNGLTKNLNDTTGDKPHGVVEAYSYDKNPLTLAQMTAPESGMAHIMPLKPIAGVNL